MTKRITLHGLAAGTIALGAVAFQLVKKVM